jgi:hypothetical protein
LTELPDGIAAALTTVKVDDEGGLTEFKLASRTEAARTLLQSIGAIVEQHAHAHAHAHGFAAIGSVAERLNEARARRRELMISRGASASEAMERYPDLRGAEISAPAELVEAIMTLPEEDQQALVEVLEAVTIQDATEENA